MNWPETLRRCFDEDRVLYSRHARTEMRQEEFGPTTDQEVDEAITRCEVVEEYPDDRPYSSVLVFGETTAERPLHVVCAYNPVDDQAVVITVYQPDPDRWEADYRRRKR